MDAFSLSDTYLLRGAAIGDIQSVEIISEARSYEAGQPVVSEGDDSRDIMIVTEGRVRVKTRDGELLDELRRGDILGEIAFLDGKGRTANVTSLAESKILVIPADRLNDLMKANPKFAAILLKNIALALCRRLRESNQQVEAFLVPR